MAAAALVGFVVALLRGPAPRFFYDAQMYWLGADAVLRGGDFYVDGGLGIRGAISAFVYTPAALVAPLVGDGPAVLAQNSVLIALVGAVLVPAIASRVLPIRALHVWISTAVTVLMLGGFAPYPLMDVWATALLLAGLLLLVGSRWWLALLGGIALGVAVNLRPAHLVAVALALVVWAIYRWRMVPLAAIGFGAALIPQVLVNRAFAGASSPYPVQTFLITDIQAQYASFTVRYDTVPFAGTDPRLFFCSPDYAAEVVGRIPDSSGALALSFLGNLPSALAFVAQKVAAALHWSFLTPYAEPAGSFSPLTPVVIVVSAVAIVALIRAATRGGALRTSPVILMLVATWLGCLATLAASAPEARFALPVVLIGVVGALTLLPGRGGPAGRSDVLRSSWPWITASVALAAVVMVLGLIGLSHPAEPDEAEICAVD
jgi:hypothetical protein